MAAAKSPHMNKIFHAAYNAARRGHTLAMAKGRSRVYKKNPNLWISGFKAGKKSGK